MHMTKNQHEEIQHAYKVKAMDVHSQKPTRRGKVTCRQSKHNECT